MMDLTQPLTPAARQALLELLETINGLIRPLQQRWGRDRIELSPADLEHVVAQVESHPGEGPLSCTVTVYWWWIDAMVNPVANWAKRPDVTLAQLVRLLISLQMIRHDVDWQVGIPSPGAPVLNQFGRVAGRGSLLELAEVLPVYGVRVETLARCWFSYTGSTLVKGWSDEAIWPFFARYPEHIAAALDPASPVHEQYEDSRRVFEALESFPTPPPEFVPRLFELALGSAKADRVSAQRALARHPGKNAVIIEAVNGGKAEARVAAAAWLARLNATEAIPVLEAALAREKQDAAAGALMGALESFGVPVEKFLDRAKLHQDAVAGLKKGIPPDLQWFRFDTLPQLEWADTGERVSAEVTRWWVVQSFRLKSPEPGAVLRRYFGALRQPGREAFALHVLAAWLAEDVKFATEANGSAIGSKGVLAVVAAGGGSEVAPVAQRYIKEWLGTRAGQGKALIQMLAWVSHPAATQLVLSIGSRFRIKGFQEEATRQAQLLAERRGWTLEELADRSIPTAGFDANGMAEIDYGTRKFNARLGPDFQVELLTEEGSSVAALPDARKDEDETRVKEAQKQWSAARKELKGVLQQQKDRLYEDLCTARTWTFEDWQLYLNQHPIVRYYTQRLVWLAERAGAAPQSFRPLVDGSLTSLADEAVVLEPGTLVRLAHDTNVTQEQSAAWLGHFNDYKIGPLFQQFGKGVYTLPKGKGDLAEIEDFRGYVVEAFALRGRATKLGYSRGSPQGGGWFLRYEKRFLTLGIEAHIEFTGSPQPEVSRKVALLSLSFGRKPRHKSQDEHETRLSLAEVPTILLGECWNDMRLIAAEGSGFDPNWEKTTEFK